MRSDVATRDLREELAAIPGVSDAEISITEDDRPTAVVWLDGTRDDDEVRGKIEALIGRSIPASDTGEPTPTKRSGLGRGLDSLIPDVARSSIPAQLLDGGTNRDVAETGITEIDRVAVVETQGAVVVEMEDGLGNLFTSTVGPDGSIDKAVLDAVKQATGVPDSTDVSLVDVAANRSDLVVAEASDGRARGAGVAHIEFGRPYAVAKAAWQALKSL